MQHHSTLKIATPVTSFRRDHSDISADSPQEFWSAYIQPRIARFQNTPFLHNLNAIAQARQMIDDELAAMHLAMRALRTRRNVLIPVSRIPSEILSYVFLFCSDTFPPSMHSSEPDKRHLGWLQVTHVCKYWRETALHHPRLWTNIFNGISTPWLKTMLARAKSVPISISFGSVATATHGERIIHEHFSHIRDISLSADDADVLARTLQSALTSPADVLQSLRLSHSGHASLCLPEHIFRDHAPRLRSLDLSRVHIPWSAPILRNLTHLKVSLRKTADTTSPDQLLGALRRMHAIETLDLTRCLPPRSQDSANDSTIVDLPHLKSLRLVARTSRCLHFVKSLTIPSSCSLHLICHKKAEAQQALDTEVISIFHAHVNRERAPLQSLVLRVLEVDFHVRTSRMAGCGDTGISYRLQLPRSNTPQTSRDTIIALCQGLPIESIRSLELVLLKAWELDWTSQQWLDVLGRCRAVEDVRFFSYHGAILTLCTALVTSIDEAGELFFHNLGRLTLEGVNFTIGCLNQKTPFYEAVVKQLTARQKVKAIQTVCIKWEAKRHFIAELEKIVPEVEWDKKRG